MNQDRSQSTTAPAPADRWRVLVEQIQAGIDYQGGCEELDRMFRHRVRGFYTKRGFSTDEAAELTQDTFIRVFSNIGTLRDPSRFMSWLFEMMINIYRNELRRRGAAKRDAFEESIDDQADDGHGNRAGARGWLASADPSPLEGALDRERSESLRSALGQLPPQMRRCVTLRLQDLKYREISKILLISIETVKAHLHQAQKRLKLTLSERPGEMEGDA
jgi:RNA polymerase sigma-70 factor, ECF subfamily